MLDANSLATMRIGPASNVAGGKNTRGIGFEIFVHCNATVDCQTGLFGKSEGGSHAHTKHNEIGVQGFPAAQFHNTATDLAHRLAEVEGNAVRLMDFPDKSSQFRTHGSFERLALWCRDMDTDTACTQRSGDLKPDKARTDDNGASRGSRLRDNGLAVGERSQVVHPRIH